MKESTLLISATGEDELAPLKRLIEEQGFIACIVNGKQNYIKMIMEKDPQLAIATATNACVQNCIETIRNIRRFRPTLPIILITNSSSEDLAINAIKAGVCDYFKNPYSHEELLSSINLHIASNTLTPALTNQNLSNPDDNGYMVCASKQMLKLKAYITKIAALDTTVLITGESGTGKELIANMIHKQSSRYNQPFVCVNCAALPENLVESELFGYEKGAFTGATTAKTGKFNQASGGTLFLDEIGDMSLYAQAKVLRIIESKEVYPLGAQAPQTLDLRIIAATNQDLEMLIAEGNFRQDLYYRLNVVRVHIPPLRERREEIPSLITHCIQKLNRRYKRDIKQLTDRAMSILLKHDWPGNIRELMNVLEAAYVNFPDDQIDHGDLPEHIKTEPKKMIGLSQDERSIIVSALLETAWNKSAAAKKLNWSRMTLYRKMCKYNIVENRLTSAD